MRFDNPVTSRLPIPKIDEEQQTKLAKLAL